jgi:Bacterial membrane protein YfhO
VSGLRRRPTLAAAVFFVLLSLLMFAPGLVPGRVMSASDLLWSATPWQPESPPGVKPLGSNHDQADSVQVFAPFLEATRERLPDVPLWNPSLMGGRPYLADMQSAVFSPFNVPGYLMSPERAAALSAALKLFVAAFGMFLLARALGMRFGGALAAGVVFGLSLWMVTWVTWPTVSVWAWLPWMCMFADLLLRRPGPLPFAGVAVVVALQFFGGHPESCFHVLIAATAFWIIRLVSLRPAGAGAVARRVAVFGLALAAGTALAAAALIPFFELLAHSADVEARSYLGSSHQAPRYLLGLFLDDYWGRPTRVSLVFPSAMEERAYYLGALALMLGVAGLVLRPTPQRIAGALGGAAALAVATGLPPLFDVVSRLPAFDTSHNSRLAIVFVFAASLLAGWGLDELARTPAAPRRARLVVGLCLALLVAPLLLMALEGTLGLERLGRALELAWGFADPEPGEPALEQVVRLASLLEWLVLAAGAAALVALRLRGRLAGGAFAALAVALLVLDLFKAGMGWNPAITTQNARPPATPAIRFLQARVPERFVGLDSQTKQWLPNPLTPDLAMRFGLLDARGYDYPVERRYERLWHRYIASNQTCLYAFCPQSASSRPEALRALGLLGVTHLLQNPADPPLDRAGLSVAYEGSDARITRNANALPRAFVVARQAVAPDDNAALELVMAKTTPLRSVAVTEEPVPGLRAGSGAGQPAGEARITVDEPERVEAEVRAREDAMLVVTDSFFPGWKASLDGQDTEVRRVDYLLRGVAVPAGSHHVELRYQPLTWRLGWITSALAALALCVVIVLGRRRRGRWT